MTVSVLIPYYNDRDYLAQAIESVLNQTYQDFELILVNHATTDDCREIAHSYKDKRIKHIDMPQNYGAGTGLVIIEFLKQATGKYVKLFCADDIMYSTCLEDMVKYMETHPQIDFAFGDVEYIDKKNKSLNKSWFKSRFKFSLKNSEIDCLKNYFEGYSVLPYIGSFAKRELFETININKSFIMLFDMSLWLSLLIKGYKIGYLNKYIAGYRIHDNQLCSSKHRVTIFQRSKFEFSKFTELFFEIDNIEILKKMFKDNKWLNKILDLSKEDLKFILAFEMLILPLTTQRITGYNYIFNLIEHDDTRKYLENKFNFGIKELREIYSRGYSTTFNSAQELSFSQIFYTFVKKLLFKISLKEYFDNKKFKNL